jgi:endo-alpha-1,4-polygalactosaminidase (GH114 family)
VIAAALAALALAGGSEAPAPVRAPPDAAWQYQLETDNRSGEGSGWIDLSLCARPPGASACVRPRVYDIDLYRADPGPGKDSVPNREGVDAVHGAGGYAICYVDAGGIEQYRPDFARFVRWHRRHGRSLLGKPFSARFPDERWANVGGADQRRFLWRLMNERTRACASAGFDGVEYDVVEAWSSGRKVTGWSVTYRDQLIYNRGLARIAHRHRLAVGLKNDLGQVPDLARSFDFAINEECASYGECGRLRPFTRSGKPVYHVEYERRAAAFCPRVRRLGFNSIRKSSDFSLFALPWRPCG